MTDTHLGGYVSGPIGDEATYFPDLWQWAVDTLDVRWMLDVGCGEGHAVKFFHSLGINADGVDGAYEESPCIARHDYATGPYLPHVTYDFIWCCEVLEHIEEQYLPNLISTFQSARYVFITHAFPGQAGHHHVNCRTPDYWLGFFTGIGFTYRDDLTKVARLQAAINDNPYNHFVRSGLVFSR